MAPSQHCWLPSERGLGCVLSHRESPHLGVRRGLGWVGRLSPPGGVARLWLRLDGNCDVIRNVKTRLKPTRGSDPLRTRTAPVPDHFPYVDGGNNLRSPIMERARLLAVLCELLSTSADDKVPNRRCEYRN
ncbi:unnamed protein product [Gadus morhua 'NCC']